MYTTQSPCFAGKAAGSVRGMGVRGTHSVTTVFLSVPWTITPPSLPGGVLHPQSIFHEGTPFQVQREERQVKLF